MIQHHQVELYHLKLQGILYLDIILLCETERVRKAKLDEMSDNIIERRLSKANEQVSEQSERESGYTILFTLYIGYAKF